MESNSSSRNWRENSTQASSQDKAAEAVEILQPLTIAKLAPSERLLIIQVGPENLYEALKQLREKVGLKHLSTITGLDLGDGIGLDYQFSESNKIITIRTILPKTNLKNETVTPIIPGAVLYEMEIHDMFGVAFQGNPWMDRRLLLPDNYPPDMPPPLLKTTSSEKIRKAVGVEK